MKDKAWEVKNPNGTLKKVVALDTVADYHPMSNRDHVVRELHDNLRSYYIVAKKSFVDNVWKQAANYHLVGGPKTPLKLFSAGFVTALSAEELKDIGGEEPVSKRKRAALQKQISDLRAGKKIVY